ncbi:unnamed protein product [Ranitomeya imitator]|uniref:SOCS box domain-containing protein n=1 Tax=Ranitomeya imitator TaxID=111125 RepID=A0ABN9LBT7_9NEOB|nr:unnamed protein product [Ranitomeya imitator]
MVLPSKADVGNRSMDFARNSGPTNPGPSNPLSGEGLPSGSLEFERALLSRHGFSPGLISTLLKSRKPITSRIYGKSECVKLLIDVGANLEAHDCHFGTPLHVACAREHLDCAKVLLSAGANVNAAKLHETALHHAAKVKNKDLIEMLVEFGGNVYARDNRGKRPSDYSWPNSPTAKCFEYHEKTPRDLSQLCRLRLRKALGQGAVEKVYQLNIPQRLIEYLTYN